MDVIDLASWMEAIGYSKDIDAFFSVQLDDNTNPLAPPLSNIRRVKKTANIMSIRKRFGSQGLSATPIIGDLFYAARNGEVFELTLKMEMAIDYFGPKDEELFNDACLDLETIANPARLSPGAKPEVVELLNKHRDNCKDVIADLGGKNFGKAYWDAFVDPMLDIQNSTWPDPRIANLCEDMHIRIGLILDDRQIFDRSQLALRRALRGLALVAQGITDKPVYDADSVPEPIPPTGTTTPEEGDVIEAAGPSMEKKT